MNGTRFSTSVICVAAVVTILLVSSCEKSPSREQAEDWLTGQKSSGEAADRPTGQEIPSEAADLQTGQPVNPNEAAPAVPGSSPSPSSPEDGLLPRIATVDMNQLTVDKIDFTPMELEANVLGYYLSLAEAVNRMEEEGEHAGWTRVPSADLTFPYNGRNQEVLLIYAYFLTLDRPWNQYYRDEALLRRVEAGLKHWMSLQTERGGFPARTPDPEIGVEWAVAALSLERLLPAYRLLQETNLPLSEDVRRGFHETAKRAVEFMLERPGQQLLWSNQMAAGMAAIAMYIELFDERQYEAGLDGMIELLFASGQSPAGYYYESRGPDYGYGNVSDSSLHILYHLTGDPRVLEGHRAYYRFLSHNLLLEPEGQVLLPNRSMATRQEHAVYNPAVKPWHRDIPMAAAFAKPVGSLPTADGIRVLLERTNPRTVFSSRSRPITPYSQDQILKLLYAEAYHIEDYQIQEARNQLPYMEQDRFDTYWADPDYGSQFLYVRRPSYYFSFAGGSRWGQQTLGPASIWHPELGTIVWSSRMDKPGEAWGSWIGGESATLLEGEDLEVNYFTPDGSQSSAPEEWPEFGGFVYKSAVKPDFAKNVLFEPEAVRFEVESPGVWREILPLLVAPGDQLAVEEREEPGAYRLTYRRGEQIMYAVDVVGARSCQIQSSGSYAGKTLSLVRFEAEERLSYTIRFDH